MNRKSKTINLMKYIIIGLGNYGHVLAEELSALGHEVIGADISSLLLMQRTSRHSLCFP